MIYTVFLRDNDDYMIMAKRIEPLGYLIGSKNPTFWDEIFSFPTNISIDVEQREIYFRVAGSLTATEITLDEFIRKPINYWLRKETK